MSVVGFITEYNPFHYGHKYHLEQSKKQTNSKFSIAIMSGSFVQRGEPSFIDKWTKAKMAVNNGVDLVLELPFIFSSQSAELFSYGGIKLMDSLNMVDYLSFGSEAGELDPLKKIATILSDEPEYYKERLKYHLSKGLSYSASRSNALEEYMNLSPMDNEYDYKKILKQSNNILGIEYLKALIKIQSRIQPFIVKRSGHDYNDLSLSPGFASATAIRNEIKSKGLSSVKELVPNETYSLLQEYINKYESFNYLENYSEILLYLIRTIDKDKLINLMDIETGLENRIIDKGYKNNDIVAVIDGILTKRYPKTRIQRIFIHLLNQLDESKFKQFYDSYPSYVRVLGANKNGLILLNKIKEKSSLPIITKFADYRFHEDKLLEEVLGFDKKATDIFFMGLKTSKPLSNMDFYNSPYIK